MYSWPCRWIAYCSKTFPAKAHVLRDHRNDSRTVNADQVVIFPEGTTTFKPNDTFAEEPGCREHHGTAVKNERPRYKHQRSVFSRLFIPQKRHLLVGVRASELQCARAVFLLADVCSWFRARTFGNTLKFNLIFSNQTIFFL